MKTWTHIPQANARKKAYNQDAFGKGSTIRHMISAGKRGYQNHEIARVLTKHPENLTLLTPLLKNRSRYGKS